MRVQWHELCLRLAYTKSNNRNDIGEKLPAFALNAIEGFLKGLVNGMPGVHVAFHGMHRSLQTNNRILQGQTVEVELAIVLAPSVSAEDFCCRLEQHVNLPAHSWGLDTAGNIVCIERQIDLDSELTTDDEEIELEFLSMLPYKGASPILSAGDFLDQVHARFRDLFGRDPGFPDKSQDIELLAHLWHREILAKPSRSQAPHRRPLLGRRGPLYLRGASPRLRRVLQVLASLHLHRHLNLTGWGHFKLHTPSRPCLDTLLFDLESLQQTTENTLRLNDGLALMTDGQPTNNNDVAASVLNDLRAGDWKSRPTEAMLIRKDDGRGRLIERLHPIDLIAQQHVLRILAKHLDRSLSDAAGAYRPGRSVAQIKQQVRSAIEQECRFAVRADIADCFPSIDHHGLFECLDHWLPRSDTSIRKLLRSFVTTPYALGERIELRTKGLAQGSPVSPLLVNLYLDRLDRQLLDANFQITRYSDDILILARSEDDAERALRLLASCIGEVGLQLSENKTGIHRISDGFAFLGETFDTRSPEDPLETLAPQRKPLVLTQPYLNLGANGESLEARREGRLLDAWPFRRLSEVIVLGRSTVSTALLEKCGRHGIPVSMAMESGYQIATIAPDSRRFHEIGVQHARWFEGLGEPLRAAYAGQIVATKIGNYLSLMKLRGEVEGSANLQALRSARDAALACGQVAQIRGHEGVAARTVFQWLQSQIVESRREAFRARRRERGAPDPLNSMLNFGYYLLYTRINGLLRSHGLNPYLGMLHDGQDDYETLVADFQEPFRCHVDRLVLRLINRQQIEPRNFEASKQQGGDKRPRCRLERAAIRIYAEEFEVMLAEVIGGVVLRDALLAQVRAFRQCVRGEGRFWLYEWKPRDHHPSAGKTKGASQ